MRECRSDDLHPDSAYLVLYRVTMAASLKAMKPKQADALLREIAAALAHEENLSSVLPIRGRGAALHTRAATRGAILAFQRALPSLLSAMRRE